MTIDITPILELKVDDRFSLNNEEEVWVVAAEPESLPNGMIGVWVQDSDGFFSPHNYTRIEFFNDDGVELLP